MKRTYLTVIVALAVLLGAYGITWATDGPHIYYRNGGYGTACSGNPACHTVLKGTFLPANIIGAATSDFTSLCLTCHTAAGEGHDKNPGSASTNAYNNRTSFIPGTYKGVSHSWNGNMGNTFTVTPSWATNNIPGGKVRCQSCHDAMNSKSTKVPAIDNILWVQATNTPPNYTNYTILGYASTAQDLAHYLRVYRAPSAMSAPLKYRTNKDYLVNPSEYTYNYATATVTFASPQSATDVIYVDITQPYQRNTNAGNAVCLGCHTDRTTAASSHAPGTGVKNGHPTVATYGHTAGLHNTTKAVPSSNIYIEGGQVLCTSCHDPHNAAGNNGNILRNANASDLCADCHKVNGYNGYTTALLAMHNGGKHSSPTVCLDCHDTHGSTNIMMVSNTLGGKVINFQNFSGANSFDGNTGNGICEACHTLTSHHVKTGGPDTHHTSDRCTKCHSHATGFQPNGGGGGGCNSCHASDPIPAQPAPTGYGWTTVADKHGAHMTYLNGLGYNLPSSSDHSICAACHGSKPGGTHPESLSTAFIDILTLWGGIFSNGGTTGQVNVTDDTCSNVSCHSSGGARAWGGVTRCDSCHAYPGGTAWAAGNGHLVAYGAGINAHVPSTGFDVTLDTYSSVVSSVAKCGLCHKPTGLYSTWKNNHNNGIKNVFSAGRGHSDCGGGDFTISVIATGTNVRCTNVDCHSGRTTPNWW